MQKQRVHIYDMFNSKRHLLNFLKHWCQNALGWKSLPKHNRLGDDKKAYCSQFCEVEDQSPDLQHVIEVYFSVQISLSSPHMTKLTRELSWVTFISTLISAESFCIYNHLIRASHFRILILE